MATLFVLLLVLAFAWIAFLTRRAQERDTKTSNLLLTYSEAEPVESGMPTARSAPIWAIGVAGVLLWFAIDIGISLLRPSLPPSTRALDGDHQQITTEVGIETLPALSPDGQWVAYRSEAEGTGDILLRRVGADTAINLTRDLNAEETDPAFSPDGDAIAFRSTYQNGGIYLVDRMGGSLRRLTNFGASPAWTPDGESIVFATRSSPDPRIGTSAGDSMMPPGMGAGTSAGWVVNVRTLELSRISRGDFRQPAVSPDGRRVAFWSAPFAVRNRPRGAEHGIWTMTLDGRYVMPISRSGATDWNPVWSPDGEFLYFLSDRDGRVGVWRVSIDRRTGGAEGRPVRMALRADRAAWLAISRQGRHLAWSTVEWRPTVLRIDYEPDSRSTRGTPVTIETGVLPPRCAEPSPDETMLAFASDHRQSDVYVMRVGASGIQRITDDAAAEGCPRWSPDGQRIAFHSNAGSEYRIWTANADGTELRAIAAGSGELSHPVWSPDGRAIAAWDTEHRALRVFRLGADGGARAIEMLPSLTHGFTPTAWSPDGFRIAGTGVGALWTYSFDTRTYERIVPGGSPTWLSTSRRLIFASDGRLVLLDVPSRFTREILSVADVHLDAPFLSPDDRHLYFSRNAPESNIWLVTFKE